jgi:hypothetical protein
MKALGQFGKSAPPGWQPELKSAKMDFLRDHILLILAEIRVLTAHKSIVEAWTRQL